jgi:hypothetical protein
MLASQQSRWKKASSKGENGETLLRAVRDSHREDHATGPGGNQGDSHQHSNGAANL